MLLTTYPFSYTLLDFPSIMYVGALFLAFVFLVLQSVGVFSDAGDVDIDADVDVDMDVDVDFDGDIDHPIDIDIDVDSDTDTDSGSAGFARILSFFGIGKVPIGIWIFVFLLFFAVIGILVNMLIYKLNHVWLNYDLVTGLVVPLAVFCSISISKYISNFVGKYMPKNETYGIRGPQDLVWNQATLLYTLKKGERNFGRTRDRFSNQHEVLCKLSTESEHDSLPGGTSVLLAKYVKEGKYFLVKEIENEK